MNNGVYTIGIAATSYDAEQVVHFYDESLVVTITDPVDGTKTRGYYRGAIPGAVRPALNWKITKSG